MSVTYKTVNGVSHEGLDAMSSIRNEVRSAVQMVSVNPTEVEVTGTELIIEADAYVNGLCFKDSELEFTVSTVEPSEDGVTIYVSVKK